MSNRLFVERVKAWGQLMRLDRPIGSLLLLWPTLWALWLAAQGIPPAGILLVFICGVFVMRAAGCVVNDYADRKIDGHVKRTQSRPLAAGRVSGKEAKGLFVVLVLCAFMLVLMLNRLTIALSVIALALAWVYPFMKRHTHYPQVVLGAAFGWAIPMAWAAVSEALPLACWLLFFANLCWTVAYDTEYAMVDRDDDLKIGVKSTAIAFGRADRHIIGLLQLLTLIVLIAVGYLLALNEYYFCSLFIAGLFFLWQQKMINHRERSLCFKAFLNNNYVGFIIFAGIAISYIR
ncbi:MAG: 4-hydroxybenzoate octaprenyltransferase [Candidatus Erwinia impunctatus]|nr:4-hydroxybenzoate octaprenyltransferase [Culicoides impunctatus]